jgi:hypothetical protein
MNDDVEDRLRKYRPAAPPPELRDRVMHATLVARPVVSGVARPFQGRVFLRDWLPATLAASIAIIFYVLASSARANVTTNFVQADRGREAMVADLASQFGGDAAAKEEAEQLMQLGEDTSRADAERAVPSGAEVPGQ